MTGVPVAGTVVGAGAATEPCPRCAGDTLQVRPGGCFRVHPGGMTWVAGAVGLVLALMVVEAGFVCLAVVHYRDLHRTRWVWVPRVMLGVGLPAFGVLVVISRVL